MAPQPTRTIMGAIQRNPGAFPASSPDDHASPVNTPRLTWVTLGKSRMRESRTYGSVRAKAEWLSYSTNLAGRGKPRTPLRRGGTSMRNELYGENCVVDALRDVLAQAREREHRSAISTLPVWFWAASGARSECK